MREVDLLELPEFEMPLDIRQRIPVEPIPEIKVENKKPTENLLIPEVVTTPLLDPEPVAPVAMDIEEYTVLGEQIDQELREKSGKPLWRPGLLQADQVIHLLPVRFSKPLLIATKSLVGLMHPTISVIVGIFYYP